jgi:hypothetical protein
MLLAALPLIRQRRFASWVLLLTVLDLGSFMLTFNPVEPGSGYFPQTSVTRFLQENAGPDRVAGLGAVKPNTLLPFELRDIGGYDSFYPRDTSLFVETLILGRASPGLGSGQMLPGAVLNSPMLDLLSVRYLIGLPGAPAPALPMVHSEGLPVYERASRLPRASLWPRAAVEPDLERRLQKLQQPDFPVRHEALVEKPLAGLDASATGEARVVSESPNDISIEVSSSGRQLLVLSDAWCPGWEATLDGHSVPILKVNQMFRGIVVPAGHSRVGMRFRPPGWTLALALFGLAALASVVLRILSV